VPQGRLEERLDRLGRSGTGTVRFGEHHAELVLDPVNNLGGTVEQLLVRDHHATAPSRVALGGKHVLQPHHEGWRFGHAVATAQRCRHFPRMPDQQNHERLDTRGLQRSHPQRHEPAGAGILDREQRSGAERPFDVLRQAIRVVAALR
jgi:hypothetical protein